MCIFVRGVANVVCDFVVREIFVGFELFQRLKVAMIIRVKTKVTVIAKNASLLSRNRGIEPFIDRLL